MRYDLNLYAVVHGTSGMEAVFITTFEPRCALCVCLRYSRSVDHPHVEYISLLLYCMLSAGGDFLTSY